MRKIIFALAIGLGIALAAPSAYANCSTHTYFYNGQMVTCTTCCSFGNCNTTCF